MKATTIKVEGELLSELERHKPPEQSLTAFVKAILRRDLLQRQLAEAAQQYTAFLGSNPEEAAWLAEWDAADLTSAPARARKTSR
jgi:hypothetical protein